MQHFEDGGDIELDNGDDRWGDLDRDPDGDIEPIWNWRTLTYRIKKKPVELLYEWWIEKNNHVITVDTLGTEKSVERYWSGHKSYGKTGRWFNPETKEFGYEKIT